MSHRRRTRTDVGQQRPHQQPTAVLTVVDAASAVAAVSAGASVSAVAAVSVVSETTSRNGRRRRDRDRNRDLHVPSRRPTSMLAHGSASLYAWLQHRPSPPPMSHTSRLSPPMLPNFIPFQDGSDIDVVRGGVEVETSAVAGRGETADDGKEEATGEVAAGEGEETSGGGDRNRRYYWRGGRVL